MLFKNSIRKPAFLAAAAMGAMAVSASAAPVSHHFIGMHAQGHAAEATFTFDAAQNTLTVRLANTTPPQHDSIESRAFTGLFWDMPGTLQKTDIVGIASSDGGIVPSASYTPEQFWAYRGDIAPGSTPGDQAFGLGAAGFGIFGPGDMLASGGPHPQPGGIDGGILSATGDEYGGQNQTPNFREFIEFTFEVPAFFGTTSTFDVTNVWFQFGSGFDEPGFPVIPLPSAGLLAGAGLLLVGTRRSRRAP